MSGNKKPEFTPVKSVGCIHVTIEAVCNANDTRDFVEVLEQLQQYGAARIVARQHIAEHFDEASRILDKRALKELPS